MAKRFNFRPAKVGVALAVASLNSTSHSDSLESELKEKNDFANDIAERLKNGEIVALSDYIIKKRLDNQKYHEYPIILN